MSPTTQEAKEEIVSLRSAGLKKKKTDKKNHYPKISNIFLNIKKNLNRQMSILNVTPKFP